MRTFVKFTVFSQKFQKISAHFSKLDNGLPQLMNREFIVITFDSNHSDEITTLSLNGI